MDFSARLAYSSSSSWCALSADLAASAAALLRASASSTLPRRRLTSAGCTLATAAALLAPVAAATWLAMPAVAPVSWRRMTAKAGEPSVSIRSMNRCSLLSSKVLMRSSRPLMAGRKSDVIERAVCVRLADSLASPWLNFSASSACFAVTVAATSPACARSLSSGATSRMLLPNSSWTMRALAPSDSNCASATATSRSASAGSSRRRFCASSPIIFSASPASLSGLAAESCWFSLTSAVATWSKLPPVRSATASRRLRDSIDDPVASARSLKASSALIVWRVKAAIAPTDRPAISAAPTPRRASATLTAPPCSVPSSLLTPDSPLWTA